ncbi:DUF1064 domain-containing protein [Secundilactobacillus muriivasis]
MVKYPRGTSRRRFKLAEVKSRKRKRNKFNSSPVIIDDIRWDSKAEGAYYLQLKNLKLDFKWHESFDIMDAFTLNGKQHQKRIYTPDFCIYDHGELVSVVDVKGGDATLTDAASLRMALFMDRYRIPVVIARYNYNDGTFSETEK